MDCSGRSHRDKQRELTFDQILRQAPVTQQNQTSSRQRVQLGGQADAQMSQLEKSIPKRGLSAKLLPAHLSREQAPLPGLRRDRWQQRPKGTGALLMAESTGRMCRVGWGICLYQRTSSSKCICGRLQPEWQPVVPKESTCVIVSDKGIDDHASLA